MELIKLSKRVYYLANFTNIGVIVNGDSCILIDSGIEQNVAKKALNILEEEGLKPVMIINTHSHSDHCGGNSYIQKKTGTRIAVSSLERGMVENPYLEPLGFFLGAAPIHDLENKFLMAEPSRVDIVFANSGEVFNAAGVKLKTIPLPGHSIGHTGIEIDDILFCGDALFSRKVLRKYKIPFFIDIKGVKQSLDLLEKSDYQLYLPAHAEPTTNIKKLVQANREVIIEIEKVLLDILKLSKTTEDILKEVFSHYNIKMISPQQYYLLKTSILAYLSYLYNQNRLIVGFNNKLLYWEKASE